MNAVEKLLGAPMAAPETARMRRLRIAVITLASTLGVGIPLTSTLRTLLGPVVTGALLAVALLITAVTVAVYFIRKSRLDDAWLDQLIAGDGTA